MHAILVSGWGKPDAFWKPYRKWFEAEGITTSTLQSKWQNFGPLQAASRQLARQIDDLKHPPMLIGHSAGGLIIRHCLGKYDSEVQGVVTIGSPFGGTKLARLAPWSASACQMIPGSNFLRRLDSLPLPTAPVLNVVCSLDVIVRGKSAVMDGPTLIAEVPQTHESVLFNKRSWSLIHDFCWECVSGDLSEDYSERLAAFEAEQEAEEAAYEEGDEDE